MFKMYLNIINPYCIVVNNNKFRGHSEPYSTGKVTLVTIHGRNQISFQYQIQQYSILATTEL